VEQPNVLLAASSISTKRLVRQKQRAKLSKHKEASAAPYTLGLLFVFLTTFTLHKKETATREDKFKAATLTGLEIWKVDCQITF
jgi:hypothetical protein